METEFIPIDYDYFDYENKNYVKIIGRSVNKKRICVIDEFEPYFWVILKEGVKRKKIDELINRIEKIEINRSFRDSKVIKTEVHKKRFLDKDVLAIKVFVTNHKDCHLVASEIGESEEIFARREYDISIITKYLMQKRFNPLRWYKIKGEIISKDDFGGISEGIDADFFIFLNEFSETKKDFFEPKVLAYDIECDDIEIGKAKILMISLYGKDFKKVLTAKSTSKKQDYVEVLKNEGEVIKRFVDYVKEYSPDIMCGYFSDGFDLPSLKERAKKNKVKLNIGLDNSEPRFSKGAIPSGKIKGSVHVDLYKFIASVFSQYLSSEILSLNEVANELIGEEKFDFDFNKLTNMSEGDWNDFFSYNLRDSEITYKLFFKIWTDLFEFTRVINEPLFNISRDTMASDVENYILHNLNRFNEIAEKNPVSDDINKRRSLGKYEGAFVFEPKPGLYEEIVMFDFTSMYGSVIVSYNLSKGTFEGVDKKEEFIFSKKQGFFPSLIAEFIDLRKKYKKEYAKKKDNLTKARSNAYKLLANASYGYLGFFGARYYCREAASSTASLAKKNILLAIEKIKKEGFEILYSDTDSIAFKRDKKSKKEVLDLLKRINKNLPGIMELDLEDFYKRGIFVSKRSTKAGAKKKYALIDEEDNLKIRGFETVRRDWCNVARELQNRIIRSVLIKGNSSEAEEILRECVKKLKNREIDIDDLIIKTHLKKPINEYVSQGPHVVAAKKMKELNIPVRSGMVISYYVGSCNGKRIGDRVFLPNEKVDYDINYYLNNQILPAVENIFDVFGVNVNEFLQGHKQTDLLDFG